MLHCSTVRDSNPADKITQFDEITQLCAAHEITQSCYCHRARLEPADKITQLCAAHEIAQLCYGHRVRLEPCMTK